MVVKVSPARSAAFGVLQRIATEKAFSAILLPVYEENLQPEDRSLCHALTLGVLRNQLFLDALIEHFSGRKITKLDLPVLLALRLGLYQLRFLTKIPARAAVNESVNLVHLARLRSATSFVNAVLRKAERDKNFIPQANIENQLEKLAVETSHPIWLLEKWQGDFGFDETTALARANNNPPPTAFRLTNFADETDLNELRNANAVLTESRIVEQAWRVEGANAKLRELVAAGKIYLQDEASQLVAHVCRVKPNETFLDVCAAPGSKTTLVAARRAAVSDVGTNNDLSVAGDFSAPRIKILRETIGKYATNQTQVVRYDATKSLPFAERSFDCVLVDAPCSGTGTIRHNPEIRWHLKPTDFSELAARQIQILTNAAKVVKPNGRLIYSTCSLEPEENEVAIARFLAENQDFEQVELNLPQQFLTKDNAARTFPQRDDVDGFFIAQLQRKKD